MFYGFYEILGIDLVTNTEVAIKFGTEDLHFWVKKEYKNLLDLGADGESFY